ncbi:MAG: beta-ketoacyl synthase N-terminal-like domain-containing protein [Planctomycetota bacterium]|jgi:hypothetical protein
MRRGVALAAVSFVDRDGLGGPGALPPVVGPMLRVGPGACRSWEDLGAPGVHDLRWRHVSSRPYAGFGRLDGPCRMAVAAAELLGEALSAAPPEDRAATGVVFGTEFGCLATDIDFYRTTMEPEGAGGASPALFTYTLPSTAPAEVAIRHGLRGEHVCFAGPAAGERAFEEGFALVAEGTLDACLALAADSVGRDLAERLPEAMAPRGDGPAFAVAFLLVHEGDPRAAGGGIVPAEDGGLRPRALRGMELPGAARALLAGHGLAGKADD